MRAPDLEGPLLDASPQRAHDAAIAELLAQVRPRLLQAARRHAVSRPDYEDLLQEALLALVVGWPTIRNPAAWLVGTVWHQCQLHARKQRRTKVAAVAPEHLELLAGVAPGQREIRDWRVDLERLSRALPPRQRHTLGLLFQGGLTEEEAANLLGISKLALHRDRWRAIARLRQLLRSQSAAISSNPRHCNGRR